MTIRAAAIATTVSLLSCSPVPLGDGERLTAVKSLAGDVIAPTLVNAATQAAGLRDATAALAAAPNVENLELARTSWRRARLSWVAARPLLFGPGRDLGTADAVDWFPIERKKLDEVLADPAPLTAESVALLGASRRGFHALELLLFDGGDGPGALDVDPLAERRRTFIAALGADVAMRLQALRAAWEGGHAALFVSPGNSAGPYPTVGTALDTVVNESIVVAEQVVTKLARPLGLDSGGVPRPELAESGQSDNALDELAATLEGIRVLYLGAAPVGGGLAPLLEARSLGLEVRVRAAFALASAQLAAVPRPLRTALAAGDPSVTAAYDAVRAVKRLLATEVLSALGATLKFNDNDGD